MYTDKINTVVEILKARNNEIGERNPGYVNVEQFPKILASYGCTTEDDLSSLSWDDILNVLDVCFVVKPLLKPKLLAQKIANIFRGGEKVESQDDKKRPISAKKADKMTLRELVEHFDAEESDNPIAMRLKSISKDGPFIVFNNSTVDVETTLKLITEIKSGYPGRKTIEVNGEVKPIYKIGERPENYCEENPVYPGRALYSDGVCDQTNRNWSGISLEVRQFVRIAIEMKVLKTDIESVHNIIDMALQPDALKKLRRRYQNVSVQFDELEKIGKLPILRIALKMPQGVPARPFDGGEQVHWEASRDYWKSRPTLSNHIARKI